MSDPSAAATLIVTMPQMGETVTEGTVTAWLKAPGDTVEDDEPLLEISTDKVDSDIPCPGDGVLSEILVAVGETVAIGTPLAHITRAGAAADPAGRAASPEEERPPSPPLPAPPSGPPPPPPSPSEGGEDGPFLSPVVRRLVAEHDLDVATIAGSGGGGRVTRDDVLATVTAPAVAPPPPSPAEPGVTHLAFSAMRRTIGERMVGSLATAAHTLVVVDVDYHRVAPAKEAARLTWLAFIARATIDALREFPHLNARVVGDGLDLHTHVHLGIAVDLDFGGLVVPVVRAADRLRLVPLAEAIAERSAAARARAVGPDEMAGGTFTITNAGRYGTLLTGPIINQPQVAILSTDGVKVRPVAVPLEHGDFGLAFHPVGNLALSFDHRALDGAYASAFLARVRELLETRDWSAEVGS